MQNHCRHCKTILTKEVIDLGNQPPSNNYLFPEQLGEKEVTYPLKVFICDNCGLVQLPEILKPEELFTNNYAYFSSTSSSWCQHANNFVENSIKELSLNEDSYVIEIASNDGYLLQYFLKNNIPCLGIEPTSDTAKESKRKGINTLEKFFTSQLATELDKANLVIANNVAAHVPDINDFVKGIKLVLKKNGVASIEFPHILNLVKGNQFDTIYHEHYSYFSLKTFRQISRHAGLDIFKVEQIKTHGGSLRVWLCNEKQFQISKDVTQLIKQEEANNLTKIDGYKIFRQNAEKIKYDLIKFLINSKEHNKKVIGYGAAAKGNTLINFCGIKADLLEFIIDKSQSKQGLFMPGSHIPIKSPEYFINLKVDNLLVLPWNLIEEIKNEQPQFKLVTAIPSLTFY